MSREQSLDTLMTASFLKCEEESHTREDLSWKWCEKTSVMVMTVQSELGDGRDQLYFCVAGFLFVCFRRKKWFHISILREKESSRSLRGKFGRWSWVGWRKTDEKLMHLQ